MLYESNGRTFHISSERFFGSSDRSLNAFCTQSDRSKNSWDPFSKSYLTEGSRLIDKDEEGPDEEDEEIEEEDPTPEMDYSCIGFEE